MGKRHAVERATERARSSQSSHVVPGSIGVPGAGVWLVTTPLPLSRAVSPILVSTRSGLARAQPAKIGKVAHAADRCPRERSTPSRSLRTGWMSGALVRRATSTGGGAFKRRRNAEMPKRRFRDPLEDRARDRAAVVAAARAANR